MLNAFFPLLIFQESALLHIAMWKICYWMTSTSNPFVESLWRVPWENLLSARFRIHQCCMNISMFWQFRKEVFLASASQHGARCLWIRNILEYDTKQNSPKTLIIIIDNSELICYDGQREHIWKKRGLNISALEHLHFILGCFTFEAFSLNMIAPKRQQFKGWGSAKIV